MAPAPTPPTTEMSNLTVQETAPAPGFKGTAKRDALRANEISIQAQWEKDSVFQSDHSDAHKEKFIVTFPFPYSNGHLHIGHAFSLTKSVFRAQFERHLGKNVLFPFAFHCTGMPIQAVSSVHLNYVVLNIIIICCVELNIIWICWAVLLIEWGADSFGSNWEWSDFTDITNDERNYLLSLFFLTFDYS